VRPTIGDVGFVGDLLQWLVILGLSALVFLLAMVAFVQRSARRHLRIDPKRRTLAPTHWATSASRGARLHRRLRTAAQTAVSVTGKAPRRRRTATSGQLDDLATELVGHALDIERRLVVAANGPKKTRRRALDAVERDVHALERTTTDFAATAERLQTPTASPRTIESVEERLRAISDALDELDTAESSAPPARVARPAATAHSPSPQQGQTASSSGA
jgi:hypothetical protein